MNVQLRRISTGRHQRGKGWCKGFVAAWVDGFGVVFRETHGWDCRCGESDCPHIAAVRALVAPDVIERIRAGRDQ